LKYIYILTICLLVAYFSKIAPYPDSEWFFITQNFWSLGIIFSVWWIQRSNLTKKIICIEGAVIFLNIFAFWADMNPSNFFYHNYEIILILLNLTEAIVLIMGAPWNGLHVGFSALWRVNNNRFPGGRRLVQDNPIFARQESRT